VDQLATIWAGLPDWVLGGVGRARALPYPALHVIAGLIVLALLSRSLAALILSLTLIFIAGAVLLVHPTGEFGWAVFWTACAASLMATAVSFHRHRLARRISLLQDKVSDLKEELAELRPKYEREVLWRRAGGRAFENGPAEVPPDPVPVPAEEPVRPFSVAGYLARTWQVGHKTAS
jgi:hypothetical protein